MKGYTLLPKKHMYFILISCAVIIFSASLETMFRVKDYSLFSQWLLEIDMNHGLEFTQEEYFSVYINANLSYFFLSVVVPMGLGIHTYFAHTKLRINGLFILIWVVLALGGLAYTVVEMNYYSIFFYVRIMGYIALLISTLSLVTVINESKQL